MHRALLISTAVIAGLLLAACGGTSTPATTTAATQPTPLTSTMPSTSVSTSTSSTMPSSAMGKDIVDTAVGAGSFTTLTTAVTAAGLVDTLKGPGPFTVFAPSDSAFAKLPAGTVETLLKDPKGKLTAILTYHVVPGRVLAADVVKLDGQKVKTVNGAEVTVKVSGGEVLLVDATGASAKVVETDVTATNGVIHVIDGVLMPKP